MWPASPSRNRRPSPRLLGFAPMHLEIGDPAQIAQADVGADPRVDHCAKLGGGRRIVARIGRVAADENEPAILRQRREQDEALGADDDSGGLGRNGKTKLDVGDHVSAPIRLPGEMLAHGMAGDAVTAAGAQEVTRLDDLRSAADVERDPDRLGGGVDRGDLGAVFDLDAARRQMIAQDLLGLPCGWLHWNSYRQPTPPKSALMICRMPGPMSSLCLTCTPALRNGSINPARSMMSSTAGWSAVPRVS